MKFIEQGGGLNETDLAQQPLPEGAEWIVESGKPLKIKIRGYGTTTARAALASGVLRLA